MANPYSKDFDTWMKEMGFDPDDLNKPYYTPDLRVAYSAGRAVPPSSDDVEWVVNDNCELGVKIGDQFFFLYKGTSINYADDIHTADGSGTNTHDDGRKMKWRYVFKREFGECCHPWTEIERKQYGDVKYPRPVSLPSSYVSYLGEGEEEWKEMP